MNTKSLLFLCALLINTFWAQQSFAQLEPDEQPATAVGIGGLKSASYDKCKGVLYINMQTSHDAGNTRPIYKAYVYIKVGTQWKNMLTIRGESAACCANTCGTGM